ncbi:PRTRC system protein B [Azonexus hydrophilus]|uniref:PRTRC system protein B n=1 Tax=Azonexus hydrophilus TaxID=418702 RepID=A0ABZ2XLI5_9RHOO
MKTCISTTSQTQQISQAFLLYRDFVTIHDVEVDNGVPVIKPGVLATKEAISCGLRALMPPEEAKVELLPAELLAKGVDYMAWWIKPGKRHVRFDAKKLGKRGAVVNLPGLVMIVAPSGWYVFAVAGRSRPTATTKIYRSPFFNVWDQGKICVGSVTVPDAEKFFDTAAWEAAFFDSYFAHPNVDKLVKDEDAYDFWADMLDGKYPKFPTKKLYATKHSLDDVFKHVVLSQGGQYD